MACQSFDPNCPYCRPAIIDRKTGKPLPPDDPVMQVVNRVFDAASREEQEAFFRVTVQNSREPRDLELLKELSDRMSAALKPH